MPRQTSVMRGFFQAIRCSSTQCGLLGPALN